jgi:Lon protease-like protein
MPMRVERGAQQLGLFPLTGSAVLPGTFLPLNIFEERYRNLVADALAADRLIGMVQPRVPAGDNLGPVGDSSLRPELYRVGGIGKIAEWQREDDGRYLIVLEGMGRFELVEELDMHRGYRRARARRLDEENSAVPFDDGVREHLLEAVFDFGRTQDISLDEDVLAALPAWRLVNVLSVALPFEPAERQLLIETTGLAGRADVLIRLLDMSGSSAGLHRTLRGELERPDHQGRPN